MTLTEMSLSYAQSAEAIGLRIAELRLAAAAADTDTARQLRLRIEELLITNQLLYQLSYTSSSNSRIYLSR